MEFEGDTFEEEIPFYWNNPNSLRDHLLARGDFAPNYYSYQLELDYYFDLESSIPDEQLFGSDLIRNRDDETSYLERFVSQHWIGTIEARVNNHIDFGRPLFSLVYPEQAAEYPLREQPVGPIQNGQNYSLETDKYPRETINFYRQTIIYLGALIAHSLDTLATKRVLLLELYPVEELREDRLSVFDDTLYTRNLVREYIEDLANIKKLIVRLSCWRRVLDLLRYDLVQRLVFLENLFVEPQEPENIQVGRRYLPLDVCRVINSFVVGVREVEEGGFNTRHEAFFRSPANVLFTRWSPEQLEYTYEKLFKKSISSSRIEFNLAGVWINPVDSCLREILDNISSLSFNTNYELDYPEDTRERSPWSDIERARTEWVIGIAVYKPSSWLGREVLTAKLDRLVPLTEDELEENL